MRLRFGFIATAVVLVSALVGCGGSGSEPSEAEMKDAMLFEMNHPPGVTNSDPITIKFFKKEACDPATAQGFRCTFDVQVASANIGASMYNNVPFAFFYKDGGKWAMRPPF
jgi:hypothetical protein